MTQSTTYPFAVPSGTFLTPRTSGYSDLGTSDSFFGRLFINEINDNTLVVSVFNEVPVGATDAANLNFDLTFTPVANSVQLFSTGIYMYPSGVGAQQEDYSMISGNTIHMHVAPLAGNPLIAHYNYRA